MMLERHVSELTQLLIADDPQRGCQRAIQVLVARNAARVGALFILGSKAQRLRLLVSETMDQAALDVAGALFARHRKALAAGEAVRDSAASPFELFALLAPLREEDRLVGVVYLDSTDSRFLDALDLPGIKGFSQLLAAAMARGQQRATPAVRPEAYLERTSPDEIRRQQLLLLLERHEWNVARVARAMGCARLTIYSWLSRYGIERRRIRKTRPRAERAG